MQGQAPSLFLVERHTPGFSLPLSSLRPGQLEGLI